MYYSEPPDSWYEPSDYFPQKECDECRELEQTIDQSADLLKVIIKQLFSKEPLDVAYLESQIDELCYYLGVKPIENEILMIQRKEEEKKTMIPAWLLNEWLSDNQNNLKQLAQ